MAHEIKVPRLGWTMEEGTFLEWLKRDGDPVKPGEPLFILETDKATQEVEAVEGGLLRISPSGPKAGDTVAVGAVLGWLLAPGEAPPVKPPAEKAGEPPRRPEGAAVEEREPLRALPAAGAQLPAISPRAARRAAELGIDWTRLQGTGRGGRIRERDILAAGAAAPLSGTRKAIAERMVRSAQSTVPVTLAAHVDATNLVRRREELKASWSAGRAPSILDHIVKLAARALKDHPALNARWSGEGLAPSKEIHIGIAVDTARGLLVPVIRDVPELGLQELAERSGGLIERARAGKLTAWEMQGGTFTVTSLGGLGIDVFTPVINHPEVAILGVGRIQGQAAVLGGAVKPREMMWLSLTFDHRAVDGAPAARFLDTLRRLIEAPEEILKEVLS